MNVLLVAGSAHFSTRDVWDGYRVALEDAGVHVIPYATFSFLRVLSADTVCNDIIGTALDEANGIDHAIFVDGLYFRGRRGRVPRSIRRAGIPTSLIATDDPYDAIPDVESIYTHRFTNELTSAGSAAHYLPTAALRPPSIAPVPSPPYAVSFLGTVFEDRVELLKQLADYCERRELRFLIAGKVLTETDAFAGYTFTDVRRRTIDAAEKWQIYADSLLTVNLFRESESPVSSPSPRVFEVTAFGHAALLTGPRREEVSRIYGDSVYHFDDAESLQSAVETALADPEERKRRVDQARAITLGEHLYQHRAVELLERLQNAADSDSVERIEPRTAWVIGCGRTGSTWLAEMLGDVPGVRRWHEPYFGRLLRHVHERPEDRKRNASFFADKYQSVWAQGIRDLFYSVVRDRFPQAGQQALCIKEVNTPELYGWIRLLFPASRMVFLVRDPFDVLDSYLDLQKPGSWNEKFAPVGPLLEDPNVRRTAKHIHTCLAAGLEAYDRFPAAQRLWLNYEDLLKCPAENLRQCCELLSTQLDDEVLQQVTVKHDFRNYKKTGKLEFRRQGRAGGWQQSDNFTAEVRGVATEVLGKLRGRLGYGPNRTS